MRSEQASSAMSPLTISLQGNLNEETLAELVESVAEALGQRRPVAIDLSEVTLVDRKAVEFFSQHVGRDFRLINCPRYLSRWIAGTEGE